AGGLGIFTLILAVLLVVKERRVWLRWFGAIAVLGVVVQAILGGQVVIRLLHYWLPVIHACFAQIVFAAVLGIAVFTSKWWVSERPQLEDKGSPSIHSVAILNAIVIYLQVIHTVGGAILFAFSVLVVLMCYRLVPRGGEVAATAPQVTAG